MSLPDELARLLTRIRGAHINAAEPVEDPPCEWCQLAGEQAAQAVRGLSVRTIAGILREAGWHEEAYAIEAELDAQEAINAELTDLKSAS